MRSLRQVAAGMLGAIVLAGAGAVTAHADTQPADPDAEFSIGPATARQEGESGAILFPVFASALAEQQEGAEPDFFAYCIERQVRARFRVDIEPASWSQFPGRNRFTDNPKVQQKVGWIINNSYPTLDLPELRARTGITGLTAREAIAGTQHAIWYFTDGTRTNLSSNATKLRSYLTGEDNAGLPESGIRPTVRISVAEGANTILGEPIGPLVVHSNVEPISVESEAGHGFVDARGEPVTADELRDGEEFYLDVPGGAEAGSAIVHARVGAAVLGGSILKVPTASDRYPHAQTLILVKSERATASDSVEVSWDLPKLPTVVGPLMPGVHSGTCEAPGETTNPFLVILPTYGIQYDYPDDALYPGGVVPITARPSEGFEIGPSEGWQLNDDGTASMDLHIPAPDCPATEEPPAPGQAEEVEEIEHLPEPGEPAAPEPPAEQAQEPEPQLAQTGPPSTGLIALAAALSLAGLAVILVVRRPD